MVGDILDFLLFLRRHKNSMLLLSYFFTVAFDEFIRRNWSSMSYTLLPLSLEGCPLQKAPWSAVSWGDHDRLCIFLEDHQLSNAACDWVRIIKGSGGGSPFSLGLNYVLHCSLIRYWIASSLVSVSLTSEFWSGGERFPSNLVI